MAIPLVLIVAQPDVGTALVYMAIFCVMIWVSGTNWKLIAGVIACAVLVLIPVWYFMNNSADGNFRLTRILIWLDPESYPDEARQVINGQIALGSGGLFGTGLVSPGSFASLGYISDDHTDFIFSIVGESFGLVGACLLVLGYILLLGRLLYQSMRIEDPFGSYVVVGVFAMMLFHVVENIGVDSGGVNNAAGLEEAVFRFDGPCAVGVWDDFRNGGVEFKFNSVFTGVFSQSYGKVKWADYTACLRPKGGDGVV